jgi:DNA (cytosine-5)-methyltransferase 1
MEVVRHVPPGGNWKHLPEDFPSKRVQQIRHGAKSGGGSRSTYYGRLSWDRPAYTINTFLTRPGNGCFIHPAQERLITVREAARLQSFPDTTRFVGSIRSRAIQVGNAVPPLLAMRIGQAIPSGNFVDLFSGVGGMASGFEMAGHTLLAAADHDRHASAAGAQNASDPGAVWRADLSDREQLREFVDRALEGAGGHIDTVVGGPPCQGFSTAGQCRIGDSRNRLVRTFLEAVRHLSPTTVVMENVPALLWRGAAFLNELIEALDDLGYRTSVVMLHAEGYGVPQLRRRLFIQASKSRDVVWPAPTCAISTPCYPKHQPAHDAGLLPPTSVEQAIGDLPGEQASDLDEPVATVPAKGSFQRWCQELAPKGNLLPSPSFVTEDGQDKLDRTWKTALPG